MVNSSFQHGVASGDPLRDRVVLWTRISGEHGDPVEVVWMLAHDPQLADPVASGSTLAAAERDHTVHVDATGLEPATTYYYGFGRPFDPVGECRTLAEYRSRYAQYHGDPDVQAMHASLPMIATLDDHEFADGAWAGGADAHDPGAHGPWSERLAAALRARWEWLPARPPDSADPSRVFRRIAIGDLADIVLVDVRSRRDQPALEPQASDPSRSMLGLEQREWFFGELEDSAASWRLLGIPPILGETWTAHPAEPLATALLKLKLIDEDGDGPDEDQWDGYPAERRRLLERFAQADDLVVLSGDIHVAVAAELRLDGEPVAAEFTTASLTSQNLDEKLGVEARSPEIEAAERALLDSLDRMHWCELSGHGYVVVEVDREAVRGHWWLVDTVLERTSGERCAAVFEVRRGSPVPVRLPDG